MERITTDSALLGTLEASDNSLVIQLLYFLISNPKFAVCNEDKKSRRDDVKVYFPLIGEGQGFPPISVETLNVVTIEPEGCFKLDNTPFFAESVALGDLVKCKPSSSADHWIFEKVVPPSGASAISIIFIENDCKETVKSFLNENNYFYEYGEFPDFDMLAVSVDDSQVVNSVISFLDDNEQSGVYLVAQNYVSHKIRD